MATRTNIESFYRDHGEAVYAFLVSLTRNPARAEDLMQDTFIKATRSLAGYRGGSPRAWLFAIARSVFIDDVRRTRETPTVEVNTGGGPDDDLSERDAINRALAALPERQRSALLLSDHLGMSTTEVGDALAISPGAARVLIHRARLGFRTAYQKDQL
ncbi:MAG: RNA polymerase sigma factor [Acidimicrobiia bacterium]|nr:RNA polymerase sigma factor [Acidimicrobiia bacterium]